MCELSGDARRILGGVRQARNILTREEGGQDGQNKRKIPRHTEGYARIHHSAPPVLSLDLGRDCRGDKEQKAKCMTGSLVHSA